MANMNLTRNSDLKIGVQVIDELDSGQRQFIVSDINKYMIVITAESGPVDQIVHIDSEAQFVDIFGHHEDGSYGRYFAHVMYGMNDKIGQKGPSTLVVRVCGPAKAKAYVDLPDANGTPTLRVQDKYCRDGQHIQAKITAGRITKTIEDAGAAPVLTKIASGGSITAGTYEIGYTWFNDNGETLMSETASTTTTGDTSKITVTAPNPVPNGAAGIKVYVKVATSMRLAGTSTIGQNTLTLSSIPVGGADEEPLSNTATLPTFNVLIWRDGIKRNIWFGDLTMDAACLAQFNKEHPDVDLIDLNSNSTPPDNLPAVMTSSLWLTGGATDNANVDKTHIIGTITNGVKTGLKLFDDDTLGPGSIAAPGWAEAEVRQELVSNAEKYHRIAYCDNGVSDAPETMKSWALSGEIDSPFAVAPYPWCAWTNPDHVIGYGDERMWMPLSVQMMAADYKGAHNYSSVFRPGAGADFKLYACPPATDAQPIGGLKYKLSAEEATELGDQYGICTAQEKHFIGPVIYDCVVKNFQGNYKFIPETKVECAIYYDFLEGFERSNFVFSLVNQFTSSDNTSDFFSNIKRFSEDIMTNLHSQGAFTGVQNGQIVAHSSRAFSVKCDGDNNTLQALSQGIVRMDVFYHPLTIARKIEIVLHQRHLTQELR